MTAKKATKPSPQTSAVVKTRGVVVPKKLPSDVRVLIKEARQNVARSVNSALVMLYWQVGKRIGHNILQGKRAEYGEQIVATLSQQLSWSHFMEIIPFDDDLKRDFHAEMCRVENWSVRTLRDKISGMLFERTALAKKPENIIRHELDTLREQDQLTPDLVFKDPYFLDFLQLNDRYIEKDIEDAILREMECFILELGVGFTFVARQKRIQVDDGNIRIAAYMTDLPPMPVLKKKLHEAVLSARRRLPRKQIEPDASGS